MRKDGPPRFAQALIRCVSRGEERQVLLGDLEETFAAMAAARGREHARRWYWKEAIALFKFGIVRAVQNYLAVVAAVVLGVSGGVGFIATTAVTTRGSYVFLFYAAVMIAIGLYVRMRQVTRFSRRFMVTLTTFGTMSLVVYWFVMMHRDVTDLPLGVHVWRIGFVLALGSIAAAIVAAFSSTKSSPFLIFPCVPVIVVASLIAMPRADFLRILSHGILPFTFFVNWRHDGWAWGFTGLDELLWATVGWLLFRAWSRRGAGDTIGAQ